MAILDAANVEILFLVENQRVENVFAVQVSSPVTQADADAIHTVVDDWITGTLQPMQANNVRYLGVTIRDVNPTGPRYDYPGDNSFGTHTGNPMANEVTFSIKKNTALSGRKFRGRFYHIGLTTDMCDPSDPNVINATASFALISTYAALMTALNTAGHPLQVLQKNYTVHPPVYNTQVPVISITIADTYIDAQRRRGPGRGR